MDHELVVGEFELIGVLDVGVLELYRERLEAVALRQIVIDMSLKLLILTWKFSFPNEVSAIIVIKCGYLHICSNY